MASKICKKKPRYRIELSGGTWEEKPFVFQTFYKTDAEKAKRKFRQKNKITGLKLYSLETEELIYEWKHIDGSWWLFDQQKKG